MPFSNFLLKVTDGTIVRVYFFFQLFNRFQLCPSMYYLALLCNYTAKHLTVGVGIVFRWHMTKKYVNTGYLIKVTDGIRESRCFFLELINKRHCLLFDSVEYLR